MPGVDICGHMLFLGLEKRGQIADRGEFQIPSRNSKKSLQSYHDTGATMGELWLGGQILVSAWLSISSV